ncbi:aspartate-semialdehyde dehydrogenase [Buchnera aphidicola (Nipponaphis monzeni)]|uniref:Aspartate-semialdehyde dehydrogenase n=1 Tax=Buchnera aphidicola (Nipponaphis monzeni) TaxID=2495405 RepID=A0A455TAI4_9GAMM|nr:aspartate-semialdehyde dehydrogenase [Buchnera aphidicola]BBI01343.1 aspartate-semialdehyde dehydrogenase [Buchnera aphidicola (Nipponaphis monzeni)]
MKKKVGFVGWRGMVGSVLLKRMEKENDFNNIIPIFFTTSQLGGLSPLINNISFGKLKNAYDFAILMSLDILVTCQGGDYTNVVYYKLRTMGWKGYWIDAASSLRMNKDALIVLDPVNRLLIDDSISCGIKTFVGSNCTVSLMLMALGGLFKYKLIDWISVTTYQAASGAGASYMKELLMQMNSIVPIFGNILHNQNISILDIEKKITNFLNNSEMLSKNFKVPLINSLIPWIDIKMKNEQTREEWKAESEVNKMLSTNKKILIDGNCVRISTLRCHSLSFTIKLNKDINIREINQILSDHNKWVTIIPNNEISTINHLTPLAVSGTLKIPIGRIRKLSIGKKYLSAFVVGDQLLWGASEPIRRMLQILL